MGLTTWKQGPKGRVHKTDVGVAKNYLTKEEISNLNLIVNQYLDFAEFQARQRREMRMEDWIKKLDGFLQLNDRKVLRNAGRVSAETARRKAQKEFERYEAERRIREASEPTSDFDLMVDEVKYLTEGRKEE